MTTKKITATLLSAFLLPGATQAATINHSKLSIKAECGTDAILGLSNGSAFELGDITGERIKNCETVPGSLKETKSGTIWNLVARARDSRTGNFYEVWQDLATKLLWGDRINKAYTHYKSIGLGTACKAISSRNVECNVLSEAACISPEGQLANAGISERKFALPTDEEFEEAARHGMLEVLPNLTERWFWSSTLMENNLYARGFAGYLDGQHFNLRFSRASVRCVGRPL